MKKEGIIIVLAFVLGLCQLSCSTKVPTVTANEIKESTNEDLQTKIDKYLYKSWIMDISKTFNSDTMNADFEIILTFDKATSISSTQFGEQKITNYDFKIENDVITSFLDGVVSSKSKIEHLSNSVFIITTTDYETGESTKYYFKPK